MVGFGGLLTLLLIPLLSRPAAALLVTRKWAACAAAAAASSHSGAPRPIQSPTPQSATAPLLTLAISLTHWTIFIHKVGDEMGNLERFV